MNNEVYDEIAEGHDYYALINGNKAQKFWHKNKFSNILKKLDLNKKGLDIGCGPGVLFYLANNRNAIGLDSSFKQIKFAKNLNKNNSFITGSGANLPFRDKCFDYVTMVEVIEHLKNEEAEAMIKEAYRVLKDDGKIVLTTPNYRSLWPIIEFIWSIRSLWPIIEFIWSKANPIDYTKEHINKQNFSKINELFSINNFKIVDSYSFFIISPFLVYISDKFSEKIKDMEINLFPGLGSIMIIEAVKNE